MNLLVVLVVGAFAFGWLGGYAFGWGMRGERAAVSSLAAYPGDEGETGGEIAP